MPRFACMVCLAFKDEAGGDGLARFEDPDVLLMRLTIATASPPHKLVRRSGLTGARKPQLSVPAHLHAPQPADRRRGRLPAPGRRAGGAPLRGRLPALRARLDRAHREQELRRVGRGLLRRRRHCHGDPRPPPARQPRDQHPRRELPPERQAQGRDALRKERDDEASDLSLDQFETGTGGSV